MKALTWVAVAVPIRPLAWEHPYATSSIIKENKNILIVTSFIRMWKGEKKKEESKEREGRKGRREREKHLLWIIKPCLLECQTRKNMDQQFNCVFPYLA